MIAVLFDEIPDKVLNNAKIHEIPFFKEGRAYKKQLELFLAMEAVGAKAKTRASVSCKL